MAAKKGPVNTIFYIVAHSDDWQLFMNPEAYKDLLDPNQRVVFIITTAGDAGKGEVFWRAREDGMKSSILYCLAPIQRLQYTSGYKDIDHRSIYYWSLNNTISYFLRLPDGGIGGEGFKENNEQSLAKLEDGRISSIVSQDGNINLTSWFDLSKLLSNIISAEAEMAPGRIFIKFLDPDARNNPLDHADHQSTGRALLSLKNFSDCIKVLFKGYGNACINQLTCEEVFWKAGIFAAYERTVFEITSYSTLAEDLPLYQRWILSRPDFYEAE